MKKLIIIITLIFLCSLNSNAQSRNVAKWIKSFCKTAELATESTQSKSIHKALINALRESSIATKKVLLKMNITPLEIQKITKRVSKQELIKITNKIQTLSPRASRLLLKDLARNTDAATKSFIHVINKKPELLNSYERISKHFSVKFRTNIDILSQIAENKKPIRIKTLFGHMLNKDIKGVKYEKRKFSIGGIIYEGVFPNFNKISKFNTKLPKDLIQASSEKQMKHSTKMLRKQINKNPDLAKNYTKEQLSAINNSYQKIPNLTWHHKEAPVGTMQLVPENIHNKAKHDGGVSIWGNGIR